MTVFSYDRIAFLQKKSDRVDSHAAGAIIYRTDWRRPYMMLIGGNALRLPQTEKNALTDPRAKTWDTRQSFANEVANNVCARAISSALRLSGLVPTNQKEMIKSRPGTFFVGEDNLVFVKRDCKHPKATHTKYFIIQGNKSYRVTGEYMTEADIELMESDGILIRKVRLAQMSLFEY